MMIKTKVKSKKAEASLIVIILLILLVLASIVILWNVAFAFLSNNSNAPEKTMCITTNFELQKTSDLEYNIKRTFGSYQFNSVDLIIISDYQNLEISEYTITDNTLKNQFGNAKLTFTPLSKPLDSLEIAFILDNNLCTKTCFMNPNTGYGKC